MVKRREPSQARAREHAVWPATRIRTAIHGRSTVLTSPGGPRKRAAAVCDRAERAGVALALGRPSARERRDAELRREIGRIWRGSEKTYGCLRTHAALREKGERVARLMRPGEARSGRCIIPTGFAVHLDRFRRALP